MADEAATSEDANVSETPNSSDGQNGGQNGQNTEPAGVDASAAGKALAARRAEIREALKKGGQDGPKADAKSAGTVTPAKSDPAPAKDEKKDPPAKPEAKADADKGKDDDLSELIREDRRIKAEAKKLAEEKAAVEAAKKEIGDIGPRWKKAAELLAKGDKPGAIKAAFPDLDDSDLFWEYAKRMGEGGEDGAAKAQAFNPDVVAKRAAELLKAEREAEAKAAEDKKTQEEAERAKEHAEARTEYLSAVNDVFQQSPSAYTGVTRLFKLIGNRANTVISERIIEYAEEHGRKTGNVPTVAEALTKVNAELIADQGEVVNDNAPKPAATVTTNWRSDPGRPAPAEGNKTLDQIRAERKAAIRAGA